MSEYYYFLKEGILVVRIFSPILYISVGVLWVIAVQVAFNGSFSENLLALIQVSGIAVLSLVISTWVRLKRRAVERSDFVQYVRNHEDELIQWRDVSKFNLEGNKMVFETAEEGYELRLTENSSERVRELISSNSHNPS